MTLVMVIGHDSVMSNVSCCRADGELGAGAELQLDGAEPARDAGREG